MLLSEEGIQGFIEKVKYGNYNIEKIKLRFDPKEPYTLIRGDGNPGIEQDKDYYLNIEENLIATDMSWFSPVCTEMSHTHLNAVIQVDGEGNFINRDIKIDANIMVPSNIDSFYAPLYIELQTFVLFYPYIKNICIKGFRGSVTNIMFELELDSAPVSRTLRERKVNKGILEKWLYIIDKCNRDNADKQRYDTRFAVINGKINYEHKTELITQKIHVKRKEVQKYKRELKKR